MAIVKNLVVENSRGSAGSLTFRQVRGQTILSEKITTNSSNTEDQVQQRTGFGGSGRFTAVLGPVIDQTFEKTKHGSRRNNFTRNNRPLIRCIRADYEFDPEMPPVKNVCRYLADPKTSLKVMIAKGGLKETDSFSWNEQYELEGTVELSRDFKAGDRITLYVPYTYLRGRVWYDSIKSFTRILNEEDIASLEIPNCFVVNKETVPQLETLTVLPRGATTAQFLIAGVVNDKRKRTTSYLSLLPGLPYSLTAESQAITSPEEMEVIFKETDLFAMEIVNKVTGGYGLFHTEDPDANFAVKSVKRDANNNTVGLVFSPPSSQSFLLPLQGDVQDAIPLMKDGKLIALMNNLRRPDTGI